MDYKDLVLAIMLMGGAFYSGHPLIGMLTWGVYCIFAMVDAAS
jgi:hypothetical protein